MNNKKKSKGNLPKKTKEEKIMLKFIILKIFYNK